MIQKAVHADFRSASPLTIRTQESTKPKSMNKCPSVH